MYKMLAQSKSELYMFRPLVFFSKLPVYLVHLLPIMLARMHPTCTNIHIHACKHTLCITDRSHHFIQSSAHAIQLFIIFGMYFHMTETLVHAMSTCYVLCLPVVCYVYLLYVMSTCCMLCLPGICYVYLLYVLCLPVICYVYLLYVISTCYMLCPPVICYVYLLFLIPRIQMCYTNTHVLYVTRVIK